MNVQDILRQFELYLTCSDSEQRVIEDQVKQIYLSRGAFVSKQGGKVSDVVFLGAGQIRVFMIGPGGRELTLYRLSPGELCTANVLAALNGGIAYVNTETVGPVQIAVMPVVEFKRLFANNEAIQDCVLKTISERTEVLLSLIESVTFARMESRVADYLIQHSTLNDGAQPILNSTHADMAADLGSAREVITRVLKTFKNRGAIDLGRKKIKLLQRGLLDEIRVGNWN